MAATDACVSFQCKAMPSTAACFDWCYQSCNVIATRISTLTRSEARLLAQFQVSVQIPRVRIYTTGPVNIRRAPSATYGNFVLLPLLRGLACAPRLIRWAKCRQGGQLALHDSPHQVYRHVRTRSEYDGQRSRTFALNGPLQTWEGHNMQRQRASWSA